jgi:hypothetical protein
VKTGGMKSIERIKKEVAFSCGSHWSVKDIK